MPYEMTTRVRFCLLYDSLKWDFIAFKINIFSIRKRILDMSLTFRVHAKVLLHVRFL